MWGTMMKYPLTLGPILERAGKLFGDVEIVSRLPDRSLHRGTYGDFYRRSRDLARALQLAGLQRGDRVATLMWNHHVHLESYFGVPVAGGVVHTLNLRLSPEDLGYIAHHAEDRFLILDDVLLPLYEQFRGQFRPERVFVVRLAGEALPGGYQDYEQLLAQSDGRFQYPELEEDEAAAMCYTSGTTGKPKGVVYSHRALVLHSLATALPDYAALSHQDTVMPVTPMFHANAWGLPFAGVMVGSKMVLPGRHLDPESLTELCEKEKVTLSCAVPTVWLAVADYLDKSARPRDFGMRLIVGGSAPPESLIRRLDHYGIYLKHLWGLTETTPLATCSFFKTRMRDWPEDQKYAVRCKQGLPVPFVEMRCVSDEGEAPWDGKTMGEIQLRGPWVAASYYKLPEERAKWTEDGWFRTGDVVTIDADGYVKLTDRTKDLIKSGGEWISSVDLENALVGHPKVREAAVIAVPHPKWQERPLAVVVPRPGVALSAQELRTFLARSFAGWQLPDAFVLVDQLPHTSTGKLLKAELRRQYRDWKWEETASGG